MVTSEKDDFHKFSYIVPIFQFYMAALTSLKNEIKELHKKLNDSMHEKDVLEETMNQLQVWLIFYIF